MTLVPPHEESGGKESAFYLCELFDFIEQVFGCEPVRVCFFHQVAQRQVSVDGASAQVRCKEKKDIIKKCRFNRSAWRASQ